MIAALSADSSTARPRRRHSLLLLAGGAACTVGLVIAGTLWLGLRDSTQPAARQPIQAAPSTVESVDVNFLTEKPYFDAKVYLNGRLLEGPDGPYTTPETVEGLPAEPHVVVFKLEGMPDLELGTIDFAQTRQVVGRWRPNQVDHHSATQPP